MYIWCNPPLAQAGGADTALMVWSNASAGAGASGESAPTPATASVVALGSGGSGEAAMVADSDDSDTDDAEDGYDSDVEREKKIDYDAKSYVVNRPASEKRAAIEPGGGDAGSSSKISRGKTMDKRVKRRREMTGTKRAASE